MGSKFLGNLGTNIGVFGGVYDEGTGHPMLAGLPGKVSDVAGTLVTRIALERLMVADAAKQSTIRLRNMSVGLTLDDLDRDLVHIGLVYRHGGLEVADPAMAPDQIPSDAILDVRLDRLPLDGVVDALVANLVFTSEDSTAAPPGMDSVIPILSKAGTELTFAEASLRLPKADANLSGGFKADAINPSGFQGAVVLRAFGLEQLVAALAQNTANPGDQQFAGIVAMINALGQDEVDGSGRTVRAFRLEMGLDGARLLNGRPFAELFLGPAMAE